MVYSLFRRHGLQILRGERIGSWFDAVLVAVEETQIIIKERDLPDLVVDLSQAEDLTGEDLAEVDLAFADADAPAAAGARGFLAARIGSGRGREEGACGGAGRGPDAGG